MAYFEIYLSNFPAELALEGPRADPLVLPHVVVEVALGDERVLADVARVGLLLLVLDADVLVDARLVEHLVADGARRVEGALLVVGHKVLLVPQPHMPRQARPVDEHLAAVAALLWLLLVLALLVPVEVALRPKHLPAVAEELLDRLLRPVLHVNALVLRQVAVDRFSRN